MTISDERLAELIKKGEPWAEVNYPDAGHVLAALRELQRRRAASRQPAASPERPTLRETAKKVLARHEADEWACHDPTMDDLSAALAAPSPERAEVEAMLRDLWLAGFCHYSESSCEPQIAALLDILDRRG